MDPRFESRIEKFQPFVSNTEHKGFTEEEVFQAKTGSNAPEVEQILVLTVFF